MQGVSNPIYEIVSHRFNLNDPAEQEKFMEYLNGYSNNQLENYKLKFKGKVIQDHTYKLIKNTKHIHFDTGKVWRNEEFDIYHCKLTFADSEKNKIVIPGVAVEKKEKGVFKEQCLYLDVSTILT